MHSPNLSNYIPAPEDDLPRYLQFNDQGIDTNIKRSPVENISFPLSAEMLKHIQLLEQKFDSEKMCAGLAAPQIDIYYNFFIFAAYNTPVLRKIRKEFTQSIAKTICINPIYKILTDEKFIDLEGCFSITKTCANTPRWKKIKIEYQNLDGKLLSLELNGYIARIAQHEIDHLRGDLCINNISKHELIIGQYYDDLMTARLETFLNNSDE